MILPNPGRRDILKGLHRVQRYARRVEKLLLSALAAGTIRPGAYVAVEVGHDPWCSALNDQGACSCTPTVGPFRELGDGPFADVPLALLRHVLKRPPRPPRPSGFR